MPAKRKASAGAVKRKRSSVTQAAPAPVPSQAAPTVAKKKRRLRKGAKSRTAAVTTTPADEVDEGGLKPLWSDENPELPARWVPLTKKPLYKAGTGDVPEWADPKKARAEQQAEAAAGSGDEDEDDDVSEEKALGDVFKTTGRLQRADSGRLGTRRLKFQRLKDANVAEPSGAAVVSVGFNPQGTLLLTASPDHCVRFFNVDPDYCSKVQTVRFDTLPVRGAKFSADGERVVCVADRPYYGVIDLGSSRVNICRGLTRVEETDLSRFDVSGLSPRFPRGVFAFGTRNGATHIVSATTQQTLFSVKGEGAVQAVRFDTTRDELWTLNGDKVHVWDLRTRRPLRVHADEGALTSSTLDISSGYYATGSTSGVVNVYNRPTAWGSDPLAAPPAPVKGVESLVTRVTSTTFNSDPDYGSQLLCIGSTAKSDSVRLVHLPSMTVYNNFPGPSAGTRKQFGSVTCSAFSPNSGLLCLGTASGAAPLLRIPHYKRI